MSLDSFMERASIPSTASESSSMAGMVSQTTSMLNSFSKNSAFLGSRTRATSRSIPNFTRPSWTERRFALSLFVALTITSASAAPALSSVSMSKPRPTCSCAGKPRSSKCLSFTRSLSTIEISCPSSTSLLASAEPTRPAPITSTFKRETSCRRRLLARNHYHPAGRVLENVLHRSPEEPLPEPSLALYPNDYPLALAALGFLDYCPPRLPRRDYFRDQLHPV